MTSTMTKEMVMTKLCQVPLFRLNSVLKQDDEGLVDDYNNNNYTDDYNNNDYSDDGKTLSGASVPFEQRAEATWTKRRGG